MEKQRLVVILLLLLAFTGKSRAQLSHLTTDYLSPTRIVWKEAKGEAQINNEQCLLLKGTGQADEGKCVKNLPRSGFLFITRCGSAGLSGYPSEVPLRSTMWRLYPLHSTPKERFFRISLPPELPHRAMNR